MAKRKAKTQAHSKVCGCEYNLSVVRSFEETAQSTVAQSIAQAEEYHDSLMHSQAFQYLIKASQDPNQDLSYILSDMFRLGVEAGRRKTEVSYLEKMVGL